MEDMEYTGSRRVDRIWAGGVAEEQGYSIEHSVRNATEVRMHRVYIK